MSQSANAKLLHDGLEKKDEIITLAAQNSRLTHDFNLVPSFPIFLRFTRAQAHSWQRMVSGLQRAQRPFGESRAITGPSPGHVCNQSHIWSSQEQEVTFEQSWLSLSANDRCSLVPTLQLSVKSSLESFLLRTLHTQPIAHLVGGLCNYSFILTQCSITTPPLYHCCNAEYLSRIFAKTQQSIFITSHLACYYSYPSLPHTFIKWKHNF